MRTRRISDAMASTRDEQASPHSIDDSGFRMGRSGPSEGPCQVPVEPFGLLVVWAWPKSGQVRSDQIVGWSVLSRLCPSVSFFSRLELTVHLDSIYLSRANFCPCIFRGLALSFSFFLFTFRFLRFSF